MRLRTESGKLAELNRNLITRLERIRQGLGIDLALWSELLGISPQSYKEAVATGRPVPLCALEAVTHYLGLSLEILIRGEIDYPALFARFNGHLGTLPERYSTGAFSRKRTSINVLAYVEQMYGWTESQHILRLLQVNEAAFGNPEEWINVNFLADLLALLKKRGATRESLRAMGSFSAVTNRRTRLGEVMGQAHGVHDLYETMIDRAAGLYDVNCNYWIESMEADGCVIAAVPNPDVQDAIGSKVIGNREVCEAKEGVFASAPCYIGHAHSAVSEEKCVHRGDPHCAFHVQFDVRQAAIPTGAPGFA